MMNTGLYIHIPFCRSKCSYCDFLSFIPRNEETKTLYIDYLIKEILLQKGEMENRIVDTIYLGGGTPSLISSKDLKRLFNAIYSNFHVSQNSENTIEINPGTVDKTWLLNLPDIGINRTSIGLQTSNDFTLEMLDRRGSFSEFQDTVTTLKNAGIYNISVDLMLGLPGVTLRDSLKDTQMLVDLGIPHVSAYSLIVHKECKIFDDLKTGKFSLPNEKLERDIYHRISDFLRNRGYEQYELSNFAKKGYRSKHNFKYWTLDEYLGLGIGAASLVNKKRMKNYSNLKKYYESLDKKEIPSIVEYVMNKNDEMSEYSFLKIRTSDGINTEEFRKIFGEDLFSVFHLDIHFKNKLIQMENQSIVLTEKGQDLSNLVEESFLV